MPVRARGAEVTRTGSCGAFCLHPWVEGSLLLLGPRVGEGTLSLFPG